MLTAFLAAARLELLTLAKQRAFVALTMLAAASLLVLVSLFALTGSDAPLGVVDEDHSDYSARFYDALSKVPHAFSLRNVDRQTATAMLASGRLVGVLTLPQNFQAQVSRGDTVPLTVDVDNLNQDLLFDLQRALPSAILCFGHAVGLPGLRAELLERDVLPHDIPFLRYLAVATLALVAFVVAAALAALAVAREWEGKTLPLLRLSPAGAAPVLLGKLAAAALVALAALVLATVIVIVAYGAIPQSPLMIFLSLTAAVILFAALGALIGALFRRTLPIVPLVFGLAMPLFIDCGALEPTRFDGETIWRVAHASPLYYVVALFEHAFFGVRITPEPIAFDAAVVVALTAVSVAAAAWLTNRATSRSRAWR
jgi:ABC-2 type transport system permease protein